jgi:RES domain-containing protein
VTIDYATEAELLSGEGSGKHGGRWNPKGINSVYASDSPETALAETLAHYRYYGIPIWNTMPRHFAAVDASLHNLLNLASGEVRRRIGISRKTMLDCDWRKEIASGSEPVSQLIGRVCFDLKYEGLIAPSSTSTGGLNLVWFPENLISASFARLK